jgi:hypothetical protein
MNKNTRLRQERFKRDAKKGKKSGVLSTSEHKNLKMVVHHQDGYSITKFEPLIPGRKVYKRSFEKKRQHA